MVQVLDHLIRRRFELDKINQQTDVVQLTPSRINLNAVIVAVQVFTLPAVAAQLMRAREVSFDHYFKLSRHELIPKSKIQSQKAQVVGSCKLVDHIQRSTLHPQSATLSCRRPG